jgi:hypothetical protein
MSSFSVSFARLRPANCRPTAFHLHFQSDAKSTHANRSKIAGAQNFRMPAGANSCRVCGISSVVRYAVVESKLLSILHFCDGKNSDGDG